jgi:hypothetical protein
MVGAIMDMANTLLKSLECEWSCQRRTLVELFPRRAVDCFLGFVSDLLDGFFDFAFVLIDLAFGAQAIVVGERAGRFFYASLDLICFSAHDEAPYFRIVEICKITIGHKGKWRANEFTCC